MPAQRQGNDQVRFELTVMALNPHRHLLPRGVVRTTQGRVDALDYAAEHNVPVKATMAHIYSQDKNLWHLSNEGGHWKIRGTNPPPICLNGPLIRKAPDEPEYVELEFEKGMPVRINGKLDPVQLVKNLNALGKHGIEASTLSRIGWSA